MSVPAQPHASRDGQLREDTRSREVSALLRADSVDLDRLLPLVYRQLRQIAAQRMALERPDHTLQTTALVNEAYLKLLGQEDLGWESKAHFYAAAASAMRRILIDHARSRGRVKRSSRRVRLPEDVVDLATAANPDEIVSLEEALRRLEERDARLAEIAQLRFYAGLSTVETARALGVSSRTVVRDWRLARAFLQRELCMD